MSKNKLNDSAQDETNFILYPSKLRKKEKLISSGVSLLQTLILHSLKMFAFSTELFMPKKLNSCKWMRMAVVNDTAKTSLTLLRSADWPKRVSAKPQGLNERCCLNFKCLLARSKASVASISSIFACKNEAAG